MRFILIISCLLFTCTPGFSQIALRPNEQINSSCEEREPIPSADGKTIYFWRKECPLNAGGYNDPGDIWFSEQQEDLSWSPAQRMDLPLNSKGHDFVWQVSADHDTLFLMQAAPGVQEPGISFSTRMPNNKWTAPVSMNIRRFQYGGTYKDYFKGPGNVLLLPNEGTQGFGGTDLYICFPINDTAWSRPVNLGSDINTAGDEDAPYLSPDGKALYFNSNGRSLGGDHNIYVSYRLDQTWQRWSLPQALPPPINSPGYDFDFQISRDGSVAWWCSDQHATGKHDIFSLPLDRCQVDIYPSEELTYCKGETVLLQAGFSPDPQASYQWLKNGAPVRGAFQSAIRVTSDGNYQVIRTSGGCQAESPVRQVLFVEPPQPLILAEGEVLCLEDSLLLRANSSGSTYQWFKNSLKIPAGTQATYWVDSPGVYEVEIANGNCSARSPRYQVLTFSPPLIFTEDDTMEGWMPVLPRWQWTNTVKLSRGQSYFQDLTAGPDGELYALTTTKNKNRITERITSFFPYGLERGVIWEGPVSGLEHGLLATDPEGALIRAGSADYLRKFAADGQLMWWKDRHDLKVNGLCTDPLGNIYTSGRFRKTINIGGTPLNAPDRGAVFIAKHSPRGELLWAQSFPVDTYSYDFGNALASDCEGNVYMAGGFDLVADFGRFPLRGALLKENYFLVKINPEGSILYSKRITTDRSRQRTGDFAVGCDGRIALLLNRQYFLYASNGIDLWSGPLMQPEGSFALTHRLVSSEGDLYAAGFTMDGRTFTSKLNKLFNQIILWQDKGAAISEDDLPAITHDPNGGIIIGGISDGNHFQGSQFDLTSGSPAFVMKYARPMVETIEREPLSLCGNQPVVLLVRREDGLKYQWIKDGQPIQGATQPAYRAKKPGTYQVIASAGGCQKLSDPVQVTACNDDPEDPPIVWSPPPSESQNPSRQDRVPESDRSDLEFGIGGAPSRLNGRRVRSQDEVTISSTKVQLQVWDHGAVDLDTVSICLNGDWILERYALQKKALLLEATLRPGRNHLMLFAHNLGTTPPNTASIRIDDGTIRKTLQLRSSLRNCGMLTITVE